MKFPIYQTMLIVWILFTWGEGVWAQQVPPGLIAYPDLIIYNGKIVSMDDASFNTSPGKTFEAMAVRGDRIQSLGTIEAVLRHAGPQTRKLDLKGRTVIPGLINTHSHMHDHSVQLWTRNHAQEVEKLFKRFSVSGNSFEELTRGIEVVIKENMAHSELGQWAWINLPTGGSSGTGIGIQYLIQNGMTRKELDALAPNIPVFVQSHPEWLLNTAARNAWLGLYEVPPTDENERIAVQNDTTLGRSLVVDQYFRTHLDSLANVIEDGLKHQSALGFTTFSSHIVGLRIHDAYMKLVREGRMPIRFGYADRFCQQVEPDMPGCFIRKGDVAGLGDKYFWNVGVTLGGIDAGPPQICTTMEAPREFKDQEWCRLEPGNDYAKAIRAAMQSRLRFVVNHDYGDKTMDYVMDIMEQVMQEDPGITLEYMRSRRLTSDHCGFYPRKAQLPRMVKLGMVISCGATLNRSAPWLKVYGAQYANRIAPIKSMLTAGLMTTVEGEFQVETGEGPTVFAQYLPLITRKTGWGQSIAPEEAIDRVSLLKMATVWASFFVLKEKEIGTLEPGKFADFVVLNKDYLSLPEAEIPTVYPLMVVLGGRTTVLREEFARELGTPAEGPQMTFRFETPARDSDPRESGGEARGGGD